MDPNTAMETIGAGAKAATKLGEIVEKVFGPRWTRKQADADAYSDQRKLQTIRENPDMEIVYVNGQLNARERTPEALAYRAGQRMLSDAIREENNIENVLEAASKELPQIEGVSDEPVDDDWITRFFTIVKDISNEEMQYVWGKILAGEIASPNSFSLKTLDTLRNISAADAQAFQRLMPFVVRHGSVHFITSENEILTKYGSSFSDVLLLDECGLVNSSGTLSLNLQVSQNEKEYVLGTECLIAIQGLKEETVKVSIGIHSLTKAGKELYQILAHSSNEQYMSDFTHHIFEKNKKSIKTSLHKIVTLTQAAEGDQFQYTATPMVSYCEEVSV